MRELGFRLDQEDDWPPAVVEWLWVESVEGGFEIRSFPLFVKGLAFKDIVTADLDGDGHADNWKVVAESGHSTVWMMRRRETGLLDRVHALGCGYEGGKAWPDMFVINVPPEIDIKPILKILDDAEENEEATFAYPALRRE